MSFSSVSGKTVVPPTLIDKEPQIFITENLIDTAYLFTLKGYKFSEYLTVNLTTLEWSGVKTAGGDAPSKEVGGYFERSLTDGKIYLFGAYDGFSDKVYEFDTVTGNWKRF